VEAGGAFFSEAASRIDRDEFLGGDVCFFQSDYIFLNLLEAAGSDENGCDCGAGEHPGQCELGESLTAIRGDLCEGANALHFFLGDLVWLEESMGFAGSRSVFDSVQIAACEKTLCERAESDAAGAHIEEDIGEPVLYPAVE
jgi:hypothetical protein